MEIIFIRHGRTKGNLKRRYVGTTDEELLEEECKTLVKKKYPKVEHVYVSPMKRCLMTASLIYPEIEQTVEDMLRETDFGLFEYCNYEELKDNKEYQKWIDSGGTIGFPQGESMEKFKERCVRGYVKCIQDAVEQHYKQIAFIVHGGTVMALLDAYSSPHKDYFCWQLENAGGYAGVWNAVSGCIEQIKKL